MGVFSNDEMVEQEGFGGPHAPSVEECNPSLEQGKPWCI
jgi:hypothetical protein